jgi:hypothetical protein
MRKLLLFVLLFGAAQAHAGYAYRYTATWAAAQAGGADSASFPLLVTPLLAGNADFATVAHGGYIQNTTTLNGQTVPADLIVTTDTGCTTKVTAWEVAAYNATTGAMELHVNNGTLSHTADTVLYVCIGNISQTTYASTATAVWDSNFLGVWHLAPGSGTLSVVDSTGINSSTNHSGTAVAAVIDGGAGLNGSTAYVDLGTPTYSATMDVSYWVTQTGLGSQIHAYIVPGNNSDYLVAGTITASGSCPNGCILASGTGTQGASKATSTALVSTVPAFVYIQKTVSQVNKIYINGTDVTIASPTSAYWWGGNTTKQIIGGDWTSGSLIVPLTGNLDEFRLAKTNRAAAWITASENMQKPSQTMVTLGSKTALAGFRPRAGQVADAGPTKGHAAGER